MGEIMQGDSVTSTILFDVLDAVTREQIVSGSEPTRPKYDLMQFPSGLGFQQDVDVVTGDTLDYVISQNIAKKTLKMNVCFQGAAAYAKLYAFNAWFAKYANHDKYITRFSYMMNNIRRYADVIITNGEPKEREGNYVTETITLRPVSPFYEETTIESIVNDNNEGMIYPYTYPYKYGGGAYSGNNLITNEFMKKIPLRVTISGPTLSAPSVSICRIDEDGAKGETYGTVQLDTKAGPLSEKEKIVIDAFSSQIYIETTQETGVKTRRDVFNLLDKTTDAFLYAEPGTSRIQPTLETDKATCTVYYLKYVM